MWNAIARGKFVQALCLLLQLVKLFVTSAIQFEQQTTRDLLRKCWEELLQSLCHLLPLVKLWSSDVTRLEQHKTSGDVFDVVNMPVSENGQVFCLSEELSIGKNSTHRAGVFVGSATINTITAIRPFESRSSSQKAESPETVVLSCVSLTLISRSVIRSVISKLRATCQKARLRALEPDKLVLEPKWFFLERK